LGFGSGQLLVRQAVQPVHFVHINGMQRLKTVTWKNPEETNNLNQKPVNPASKLDATATLVVMPNDS
jgi:hypothetical protein